MTRVNITFMASFWRWLAMTFGWPEMTRRWRGKSHHVNGKNGNLNFMRTKRARLLRFRQLVPMHNYLYTYPLDLNTLSGSGIKAKSSLGHPRHPRHRWQNLNDQLLHYKSALCVVNIQNEIFHSGMISLWENQKEAEKKNICWF